MEDEAIEARAFSFLPPEVEPVATHLIAAHIFADRTPAEVASSVLSIKISH